MSPAISPPSADPESSVSVIIPNFNGARWLSRTIESCFIQGVSLREVIVVDDGSTDESHALLDELSTRLGKRLRVIHNPTKGANTARNAGFEASTGAYIQWLDADDQLLPGKFAAQMHRFSGEDAPDVVFSDFYIDSYNPRTGDFLNRDARKKEETSDFLIDIFRDKWSPPNNYLFSRKVAEQVHDLEGWKPGRKVAQDREYVTVAALTRARFAYAPGFYCVYNRWSEESTSSMPFKERLSHQLELESRFHQLIDAFELSPARRRRLNAILNAHALNACYYNPSLTLKRPFWPWAIDFSIIHWKKLAVLPMIYAYQMGQLALLKVRRNAVGAPPKQCVEARFKKTEPE